MKYIKSYRIFESVDLQMQLNLKYYSIFKYVLNEDGSIDCNQNVTLIQENLYGIPFIFNKIDGSFDIFMNNLKSLINCPKYVDGQFICSNNLLKTLEYGPEYVGDRYNCSNNNLTSLKGCVEEVYENFDCYNNYLSSLEFCPMEVEGDFNCDDNRLEYLDRSPFIKGDLYCNRMFKTEPEFSGHCKKLIWNDTH